MSGINLDYHTIDAYLNFYVLLRYHCFQKIIKFMGRLIKNFRPLLALLLLLQATTVYALPADIHINFCIGPDGHFKISSDFCAELLLNKQSQTLNPGFFVEDHHGDCLDIVLNCDAEEELFSPSEETLLAKTEIVANSPPLETSEPIYFLSYIVSQSSILNSHLIKSPPFPAHLGLVSTTVLLI